MKNYINLNKSQVIRHTGYLFWTLVAQGLDLGGTRVILFPILLYLLGKEEFGVFVIALSIVMIIGIQPANGLMTGLLRYAAEYSEEKRIQFYRTAMQMGYVALGILVVLGLLVVGVLWQITLIPKSLLKCLVPLIISLYADNQFTLILTHLRYRREFRTRALWYGLRSGCSLLGGLAGAIVSGAIGAAWGFSLGIILAYLILRYRYSEWMKVSYNSEMSKVLKNVWFHMTVAGVIALAGPYINRIVLGASHGFANVTELVAATSILAIVMMLISNIGYLTLSVISRYSSIAEMSMKVRIQYLALTGAAAVICPVVTMLFGPILLRVMFSTVFNDSLNLLYIVVLSIPFVVLTQLMRPIVLKFASIKITPIINTFSLVATLLPAVALVPKYEARGAAWAIVIGKSLAGMLWAFAACRVLLGKSIVERN
jgi:O-antigen/teichoic acid export membrane protein